MYLAALELQRLKKSWGAFLPNPLEAAQEEEAVQSEDYNPGPNTYTAVSSS